MALDLVFQLPLFLTGGVERYNLTLIRGLREIESGLRIGVAFIGDWRVDDKMLFELLSLGVNVVGGPGGRHSGVMGLKSDADVWDYIGSARNAVVWGGPLPENWRPLTGNKLLGISHGDGNWTRSWISDKYDVNLAVSDKAGQCFSRFVNIGGGVQMDRVARTGLNLRSMLKISAFDTVVGYLGRFSTEKGIDLLKLVPKTVKLVCMGAGVERLPDWAIEVPFGYCSVGDFLAMCDALVMPSPAEGMPLVVLEAWMAGVPVLSRNGVGCIPETEALCGGVPLTTKFNEHESGLDDALSRALSRHNDVRIARDYVWNNCTMGQMARRWLEVLK